MWELIETATKDKLVIVVIDGAAVKKPIKLAHWFKSWGCFVDINTGKPIRDAILWHPISNEPSGIEKPKRKKTGSKNPDRDDQITIKYYQGKSTYELSKEYGISPARVWQIAKNYRRRSGGDILSKPEVRL